MRAASPNTVKNIEDIPVRPKPSMWIKHKWEVRLTPPLSWYSRLSWTLHLEHAIDLLPASLAATSGKS